MTLTTVPCAVCGASTFTEVYPSTIVDPLDDPASYFSSSRRHAGHLAIVRCDRCGLLLTNPRDDDTTLEQVYAALEDRAYAAEDANRRLTAEEHLALVSIHRPSGRLLDIGCATGIFACLAHQRGWRVTGLDASVWAVARARERCPGATFAAVPLEQAQFRRDSFDVVTLWDVLEHVRSPAETLRLVREWLSHDGLLVLNVPNVASVVARGLGRRWVLLLREHLWYFSPATMERMLTATGFRVICIRPNFVRFSVANIASRIAQYPGAIGRMGDRLANSEFWKHHGLRFPIGEMNVVARKSD
jgi:2-polyprenyl-3-methyl-5-hydroxy-6-metoxy-1,4-benzoquinol methylase